MDQQLDALTAQLHEWTESALSLDEAHFPRELLNELEDLIGELRALMEEYPEEFDRTSFNAEFVNPEMAEVVERFPRVRRLLQHALGSDFMDRLAEEAEGLSFDDDDDD